MTPAAAEWAARVGGDGCPLDAPRPDTNDHWDFIAKLTVSSLYLSKNQTYRGQCQPIFDPRHVARIDQLSRPEWASFCADLYLAQQAVMRAVRPDHLNVESLGNVVPHLQWHIVPRYVGDPKWGAPIWQVPLETMPDTRLPDAERAALVATLRQALAGPLTSMTAVGLTSRWVAANRALETEHLQPLYRDVYARELAGEAGYEVIYTMRTIAGMGTFVGPDPFLTIRTRFFDDGLIAAVRDGIDQVVVLAAGMDARAFRLDWPAGVRLFEIDRDDVFAHKEPILARMQARSACDRRIVRQDLAQSWTSSLDEAGFDRSRRTAFLAEGLLYYLDEPAALALIDAIGTIAAPGSWLGFDAMNPEVLSTPFMAPYLKKLEELGCPWRFGLRDPDEFMAARGWQSSYVLPGEPDANYGRWIMPVLPRTMPGLPRMYLIRASRV